MQLNLVDIKRVIREDEPVRLDLPFICTNDSFRILKEKGFIKDCVSWSYRLHRHTDLVFVTNTDTVEDSCDYIDFVC